MEPKQIRLELDGALPLPAMLAAIGDAIKGAVGDTEPANGITAEEYNKIPSVKTMKLEGETLAYMEETSRMIDEHNAMAAKVKDIEARMKVIAGLVYERREHTLDQAAKLFGYIDQQAVRIAGFYLGLNGEEGRIDLRRQAPDETVELARFPMTEELRLADKAGELALLAAKEAMKAAKDRMEDAATHFWDLCAQAHGFTNNAAALAAGVSMERDGENIVIKQKQSERN